MVIIIIYLQTGKLRHTVTKLFKWITQEITLTKNGFLLAFSSVCETGPGPFQTWSKDLPQPKAFTGVS